MQNQDDIARQEKRLEKYRANLAHLIEQAVNFGGEELAPIDIKNVIHESRVNIGRVKSILRGWGVVVVDHPDDDLASSVLLVTAPATIFISYKRHTHPDESLALSILSALQKAGHQTFIDQTIGVGKNWPYELQRQIEASDYLSLMYFNAYHRYKSQRLGHEGRRNEPIREI